MTGGITLVLTIFAMTTKKDFTVCLSFIWIFMGALLMFGIFSIIFSSQILNIVYCTFGIMVYSVYLIIDTQLIMGNKKYKLTEDDYVIGVIILYIDIIQIFMYILALLSSKK